MSVSAVDFIADPPICFNLIDFHYFNLMMRPAYDLQIILHLYGGRKVDFRIVYFSVIWKYTYTILFLPYKHT